MFCASTDWNLSQYVSNNGPRMNKSSRCRPCFMTPKETIIFSFPCFKKCQEIVRNRHSILSSALGELWRGPLKSSPCLGCAISKTLRFVLPKAETGPNVCPTMATESSTLQDTANVSWNQKKRIFAAFHVWKSVKTLYETVTAPSVAHSRHSEGVQEKPARAWDAAFFYATPFFVSL